MALPMLPDTALIRQALACRCPRCVKASIYQPGITLTIRDKCPECGLNLAANDSGDGPAVFLIFILGALLVPLALLFEHLAHPPLWAHAVLWTIVALGLTLGALRPLKAYVITLQYKYRPEDWETKE